MGKAIGKECKPIYFVCKLGEVGKLPVFRVVRAQRRSQCRQMTDDAEPHQQLPKLKQKELAVIGTSERTFRGHTRQQDYIKDRLYCLGIPGIVLQFVLPFTCSPCVCV